MGDTMRDDNKTRRSVLRGAGLAGMAAIAGCSGSDGGSGGSDGSSDGGDGSSSDGSSDGASGSSYDGQELNVLTWGGYEGVSQMVEDMGASTNLKLISSDKEGFNTLQGGGASQFDVLVLDNQWAQRNAKADTIVPLRQEEYPAAQEGTIIEKFNWPYQTFGFDGEQWAIAPRWGWEGMGYNDDEVELADLESEGYAAIWDGDYKAMAADAPTSVIPLVMQQIFDLDENPMTIEVSDARLETLEETLVEMFNSVEAVHQGAAALRQAMLEGNAEIVLGVGNFELSQLAAEGFDWAKVIAPPEAGGWFWTEGLCLVNNPDLNRDLANEFINACLSPEGQRSICWDGESKGAPANTAAFDAFSEEEQKTIMMYKDKGFEAADEILSGLDQYLISPQQEQWTEIWERAKARSDL